MVLDGAATPAAASGVVLAIVLGFSAFVFCVCFFCAFCPFASRLGRVWGCGVLFFFGGVVKEGRCGMVNWTIRREFFREFR